MFDTPEEMEPLIEAYFEQCDAEQRPYTVAGLAYDLGFADRHSFSEYLARDQFTATLKAARLRIERQRSERLVSGASNVAGLIFDLKNNFGWKDQVQTEITGKDGGPIQTEDVSAVDTLRDRVNGVAARIGANGHSRPTNGSGSG